MPRPALILPLLLLPALCGCGGATAPAASPLESKALAAVVERPGVERERLARAVDALFTAPAAAETRALLVLHRGRVVAERYAPGYHENTRFVSWSMAKTMTAVVIGLLVADGRLRLDESAPVPAWRRAGDPRGEITLRQLLQMRSGLRHSEASDPVYQADEVRMLFLDGRDDMAAYAEAQPLEAEPGARFEYSTATTVILADLATRALTASDEPERRRAAMHDYLRSRLFEPLGARSMLPEFDRSGTLIGGSLVHATLRDWGRFGELLRNGGAVKGAQVLPRGWIAFMTSPSPRSADYGAQTWLNRRPVDGRAPALFPDRGPASLFACIGHLGQYILVSPRQQLVVVRLGKTDDAKRPGVVAALERIVALFPSR